MSKIYDGGQVYPIVLEVGNGDSIVTHGITRRDQCADRIAASIVSDFAMYDQEIEDSVIQWVARISYKLSDAMIAEGRKE